MREMTTEEEAEGLELMNHAFASAMSAHSQGTEELYSPFTYTGRAEEPFKPFTEVNNWLVRRTSHPTIRYSKGGDGCLELSILLEPSGEVLRSVASAMEMFTLLTEELVAQTT